MNSKGLYYSLVLAQTDQEFDSSDDTEYPGTSYLGYIGMQIVYIR